MLLPDAAAAAVPACAAVAACGAAIIAAAAIPLNHLLLLLLHMLLTIADPTCIASCRCIRHLQFADMTMTGSIRVVERSRSRCRRRRRVAAPVDAVNEMKCSVGVACIWIQPRGVLG